MCSWWVPLGGRGTWWGPPQTLPPHGPFLCPAQGRGGGRRHGTNADGDLHRRALVRELNGLGCVERERGIGLGGAVATSKGGKIQAHHVVRDGVVEAGSSYCSLRASRRQAVHACWDCVLCGCGNVFVV